MELAAPKELLGMRPTACWELHKRQSKTMNKEAQRIAIAKACGWKAMTYKAASKYVEDLVQFAGWDDRECCMVWLSPVGKVVSFHTFRLPDYLNDLNAMHGAIAYARENLRDMEFDLFWCDGQFSVVANMVIQRDHWDNTVPLMLITAPQYAEIFLKTLNLWEENN